MTFTVKPGTVLEGISKTNVISVNLDEIFSITSESLQECPNVLMLKDTASKSENMHTKPIDTAFNTQKETSNLKNEPFIFLEPKYVTNELIFSYENWKYLNSNHTKCSDSCYTQ